MAIGPVQLLVVSFDKESFTGAIVSELRRLRENDVIRVIDALVVRKGEDGTLAALPWSDLSVEEVEDMGAVLGALIGVGPAEEVGTGASLEAGADGHFMDDSEVWDVADSIPNGSVAAIALIEHLWAIPLRDAITRHGGIPVSGEWVHALDLVEIGLMDAADLERA